MKTKAKKKQDMLIGVCDKCDKNLGKFTQTLKCSCGGTVYPMFKSEYDEIIMHIREMKEKYPNDTDEDYVKRLIF